MSNKNYDILDKLLKDVPPMVNEPNQDGIDAETARRLRQAAEEQRQKRDEVERYLRSN